MADNYDFFDDVDDEHEGADEPEEETPPSGERAFLDPYKEATKNDSFSYPSMSQKEGPRLDTIVLKNVLGATIISQKGYTGPEERRMFFGCHRDDLEGVALKGENLSNLVLDGAVFRGGELVNVNFAGSKLEGSNFDNCLFHDVDFVKARLMNSSFRGCDLQRCSFRGADIRGVGFTDAVLPEKRYFEGAIAENAKGLVFKK